MKPDSSLITWLLENGGTATTWVLCDIIRKMAKKLLPEFAPLLPRYEQWAADPALSGKDRRSVESAIKVLRKAGQT